jgi:hypothetical protein
VSARSHPSSCLAPPHASEWDDFSLSAADFKRLRAALVATPEWNGSAKREATAAEVQAAGDHGTLASVLRRKSSKELQKKHMLALCRLWNYRSDLWYAGELCHHAPHEVARLVQPLRETVNARVLLVSLTPSPGRLCHSQVPKERPVTQAAHWGRFLWLRRADERWLVACGLLCAGGWRRQFCARFGSHL